MRIQQDNPLLNYSGRIDWRNRNAPVFFFPCTSVSARFTGSMLWVENILRQIRIRLRKI